MRIFIFVFAILIFCNSCNREKSIKMDKVLHIDLIPAKIDTEGRLSEVVKSIRLIPLETKPECFIESVSRVFFGKKYIIFTTRGSKCDLMVFDTQGNFIRKIGRQGKGPGEYNHIREFSVLEDEEEIYVNNGLSGDIIAYSFDGSFIKKIDAIPFSGQAIQISPVITAYSCYLDYRIKIVNSSSGDTIRHLPQSSNPEYSPPFLKGSSHSGFFYTAYGQDTIWIIETDTLYPAVTMDFGEGHISFNDWTKERANWGNATPGKIIHTGYVIYLPGYYHFSYELTDNGGYHHYYHVLLNEITSEAVHLIHGEGSDDILFAGAVDFRCSTPGGELVAVVGANDLIDALPDIEANRAFIYDKELLEDIRGLSIENNEVLVIMKLK